MQCDFCDAPADIHADRCPSCHASFREECPKCGSLKSVFETCAKCPLELRLEPRVKPQPGWSPGPPVTTGSVVLRLFGVLQILLGLWALAEGIWPIAILCVAVLLFSFAIARMREVTEAMWQKLERIEAELRKRRRD